MPVLPRPRSIADRPRRALSNRAGWVRRAAAASLLLVGVLGLLLNPAGAQGQRAAGALFREEAQLTLPAPAAAVAINADESILAAATPDGGGRWRVHLFDRPSRGKLGVIQAAVGEQPRLQFSPVADLLLVAGSERLELWALPIAPLEPDQALSTEHRRWVQEPTGPPGDARFGAPPRQVYWSVDGAVYRRSTDAAAVTGQAPLWKPDGESGPIVRMAFDPDNAVVALLGERRKEVPLLDLNTPHIVRRLQGHRFAVVAAQFAPERPLLTLDAGNNLVQWQGNAQPVATTYLDQVPKGFSAVDFSPLGEGHLLLMGKQGKALAIEARTAQPVGELLADGADRIVVSPTGRYVLAGEGSRLRLYGFARPASPLAYVRRLRRLEAFELAQSYVRLMDDSGISPQLKADLLNEAVREPPGLQLNNALASLKQARGEGDPDRIRYWAEQVLALRAEQPDAVAALREMRELHDGLTLEQAREAYEAGQHRVAISLLFNQIENDSRYYADALELIRQAEAQRSVETALIQAREKLNLSDYRAAEALVREALRKDPDHAAALALEDEIDDRSGAGSEQLLAALLGFALAALLVGFVGMRLRRYFGGAARRSTRRPPDTGRPARAQQAWAPPRAAEPKQPEPERPPPRPRAADATRRRVVEALVKETEAQLHALRQADVYGRQTARLMELEAELSAIQRRVADPAAELGPLHNRLKTINAQTRRLRVDPRGAAGAAGTAAGAAGAADAAGAAGAKQGPAPESFWERSRRKEREHREREQQARAREERDAQQAREEFARQQAGEAGQAAPAGSAAADARTHYEVLQLPPSASSQQIRDAYHKLIKQYHPDLHNASQFDWVRAESERMSRRIAEAYHVLGDEGARARYDRDLQTRPKAGR